MATYPIKMLRDENQEPFVPMVSADSIYMNDGKSFEEKLAGKIGVENLAEGTGINIETKDDITTISVDFGASDNIIDNLDTTVAGQGPLDARQGNVLKNMIPTIVDNLDSTDATKVLSANQGRELKEMSVPVGGATGQVLKKASNSDHELEWGDAADPNAIVGDGSIMKIIELTYAEYKTLESNGELQEDTEYHITDVENGTASYMTEEQIQEMIDDTVKANSAIKESTVWHDTHCYTTFYNDLVLVYGYQDITITTAESPAAGMYYADDIVIELPCYFNDLNYVPMATMRADGALVWIYATQVVDTDHISVSIASPSARTDLTVRIHYHCMGTRRKN
jgi:hypothetical protein